MTDLESGMIGGDGATSRKEKAKEIVGQASQALKAEAQSFASVAQDRVRAEAQKGTQVGAKTLGDFANAVRRAGDELSQSDQSPASRLVGQAADGLESLSRNLADKDPGDLLNAVRDFGRKNPVAFIGGAVLVGLAVGRFARASESPATTSFSDEDLGFTESYEPAPAGMAGVETDINAPLASNLGALDGSTADTTASPLDVDDGTSALGEADAATSPPIGGR